MDIFLHHFGDKKKILLRDFKTFNAALGMVFADNTLIHGSAAAKEDLSHSQTALFRDGASSARRGTLVVEVAWGAAEHERIP